MSSEIEKTAQEIEEGCKKFQKIYQDLIEQGEKFEPKVKDRLEDIGEDLKGFYSKSEAIQKACILNTSQFKEGRLEKDAYERRLSNLAETMAEVKFDFQFRVRVELENYEKQFSNSLKQRGVPSVVPPTAQELKVNITKEERKKVEAVAESIDKTRENLNKIGFKDTLANPEVYNRLGVFHFDSYFESRFHLRNRKQAKKSLKKAKQYFEKAVECDPKYTDAWINLGRTAISEEGRGKVKQAIKYYEKALELEPKNGKAWDLLGRAHQASKDYETAIKCYEKALEIEPRSGDQWIMLGQAYAGLKHYDQALKCYKKALELDPKNWMVWYRFDELFKILGNQEAMEFYKKCVKKYPKIGHVWQSLGDAYGNSKDREAAVQCYKKALEIDPKNENVLFSMGLAYYFLHKYKEAIKCFEKGIEVNPKSEGFWDWLARAYGKLGDKANEEKCKKQFKELKSRGLDWYLRERYLEEKFKEKSSTD